MVRTYLIHACNKVTQCKDLDVVYRRVNGPVESSSLVLVN
jgi:hypothetical protein